MTITPQIAGFIRGIGYVVVSGILAYVSDITHLTGFLSPQWAAIVVVIATGLIGLLDGHVEVKTGRALLGAAKLK